MPVVYYEFRVELMYCKNVWRRIAMRATQTLSDLHQAIFDAFDRVEEHLYSFYFPHKSSTRRPDSRNSVEFVHPYGLEEKGGESDEGPFDASKAKLQMLQLRPSQVFYYLFDYGDLWWHKITVGSLDAPRPKGKFPWILERHGKSPPQYPDYDQDDDYDEDDEGDEQ